MNFDSLFADPRGRTSRSRFVPALLVLLAAVLFYAFVVRGRTAQFCLLALLYPALMLHARRLHDMGHGAVMLVLPAALLVAMFGTRLDYFTFGERADSALTALALVVSGAFALWGCLGRSSGDIAGATVASR